MDVSSLRLTEAFEGCTLILRVRAGARREGILGVHGDALKVGVHAAPERGRANRAVLELLARALDVPPGRVRLLSGRSSPDKTVLIEGMTREELRRRLSAL